MSVTQYVGARYVPLFAEPIDWDITKAYEPLTIVYYQGNSYTSKQSVPTGTDINNEAFWALTGNYNAQIEQYRAEVTAAKNEVDAATATNTTQDAQIAGTADSGLKAMIDANTSNIATNTNNIATNTSNIATNTSNIATNTSNINTILPMDTTPTKDSTKGITSSGIYDALSNINTSIGKYRIWDGYVLCFGDSLTIGTQASKYWPSFLADFSKATVKNYGISGQGFVNNAGGTFLTQLNTAISTEGDKEKVTHIIVAGGYNDYATSAADETSAVNTFIQTAKTNFPNAIIIVVPMLCGISPLDEAIGGANESQFRSKLIEPICYAAYTNGAIVAPAPWTWLKGYDNFDIDGIHVNNAGQSFIACKILNFLTGGEVMPMRFEKLTASSDLVSEIDILVAACGGNITIKGRFKSSADMAPGTIIATLPKWAYSSIYAGSGYFAGAAYYEWAPSVDNGSRILNNGTGLLSEFSGTGNTWIDMVYPMGI